MKQQVKAMIFPALGAFLGLASGIIFYPKLFDMALDSAASFGELAHKQTVRMNAITEQVDELATRADNASEKLSSLLNSTEDEKQRAITIFNEIRKAGPEELEVIELRGQLEMLKALLLELENNSLYCGRKITIRADDADYRLAHEEKFEDRRLRVWVSKTNGAQRWILGCD